MNMASEDIKDMLEAESSLGLTFGTDLFIGREPTSPSDCVTIIDMGSSPPSFTLDSTNYYYSSVVLRVRNTSYPNGMALAWNIMDALHSRAQEEWNATLYTVIESTGEPALLDWDDNNRAIIIINFNLQRR